MKRTDIHCPSNLVPKDYEFVGFLNFKDEEYVNYEYCLYWKQRVEEHMKATGGKYSRHAHGGSCYVCGNANAIYMVVFYHIPTNTYLLVGRECAEKISEQAALGLEEYTQNIRGEGLRRKRLEEARVWLHNAKLDQAWDVFTKVKENAKKDPSERQEISWEESTVFDIVSKLVAYGSITERQEAFVKRLLDKINQVPEPPKPEREIPPVQAGRQTIEGKIVGIKFDEVWRTTKVMIEADNGQKFWGTFPSMNVRAERGLRIRLVATVTPSDKDHTIGFFSRPRNGEVIEEVTYSSV